MPGSRAQQQTVPTTTVLLWLQAELKRGRLEGTGGRPVSKIEALEYFEIV